ncbi:MAG TPA: DMT family transporter [Actinomycetota bacterium]|nr:DMT family transporter [Actinomycetota bacterium]
MRSHTERLARRVRRLPRIAWVVLATGVLVASTSAILSRYAFPSGLDPRQIDAWQASRDAHPLALSFWRCAAGAAALLPFCARRLRSASRFEVTTSVTAGAFLAVHFATWISSLTLTSVAAAVLLVSTTPIFVAVTARLLFDERLPRPAWFGIVLALAGTAAVAGGDLGGASAVGNMLALAGGATAAGYALAGERARRTFRILEYSVLTYGTAAVLLLSLCVLLRVPLTGYSASVWLAVAAVTLGPQILGHTFINFALKDIGATVVSVAIMAEPVIATALAYALFAEVPTWLVYPGGALILAGIYLVSTARTRVPLVLE